jgi:hypothetical protein
LDEAQCTSLIEPLHTWAGVAETELAKLPPYYLRLEGASVIRSGIVVLGFPPTDYTPVRNALRNEGPVKEPHQQDVHHVTIARWTKPVTGEMMDAVNRGLMLLRYLARHGAARDLECWICYVEHANRDYTTYPLLARSPVSMGTSSQQHGWTQ